MSEKVLVALSGGVDSAVAALLLQGKGYKVSGAYMRAWQNESNTAILADCPWLADIENAQAVCEHLGIDFEVINLMDTYKKGVVEPMIKSYAEGLTPNPDIFCNRVMKFGAFHQHAKQKGFDKIATGHYCCVQRSTDGVCRLARGSDANKDQSYFLAMVQGEVLKDVLMPLGELEKPKVRELAHAAKLPNAERKDSQGVCFLGKICMRDFLQQFLKDKPGPIVELASEKPLGVHRGLHLYTLGQRHGFGVASAAAHQHYVVIGKDFERNALQIALESDHTPKLWQRDCTLNHVHWINCPAQEGAMLGMPRYRSEAAALKLELLPKACAKLRFEKPQRAITPGQICALYDGSVLLGGGTFA